MTGHDGRGACERFRELMLDEAVEELSTADAEALTAHAGGCAACAAARADLRKAVIRTRSLLVPEPAPQYWDHFVPRLHERIRTSQAVELASVRQKLEAVRSEAPRAAAPDSRRGIALFLAGLAAAATLALFLVPAAFRGSPPVAPPTETALALEPLDPLDEELADVTDGDEAAELLLARGEGPDALDELLDGLSDDEVAALEEWLASEPS